MEKIPSGEKQNSNEFVERGFFVGADSFEKLYDIIKAKGGIETSNGFQDAETISGLLRLYELTGDGENFLSNHDGLRDTAIALLEKREDEKRKEIEELKKSLFK